MSMVRGLGEPCPHCGRTSGDHTLREWSRCMGQLSTDLPYEDTPDDMAAAATAALRERFKLDDDLIVADSVVVRAVMLDGGSGPLGVRVPGLIHDFQVGVPGQPPTPVARVAYFGDAVSIRKYGQLVRDSANGAARAAR